MRDNKKNAFKNPFRAQKNHQEYRKILKDLQRFACEPKKTEINMNNLLKSAQESHENIGESFRIVQRNFWKFWISFVWLWMLTVLIIFLRLILLSHSIL